ncbi:MAG: hypothetical protein IT376_20740 [Polyangiaceae bacterium]|nr:hypothetical protein [Polyangiaceae bacterium]
MLPLKRAASGAALCASAALAVGCGEPEPPRWEHTDAARGATQLLSFEAAAPFWAAPFPIEHRARPDGSLVVADFPNPFGNATLAQLVALLEGGRAGFSLNGAIFLPFDAPLDSARLPATPAASIELASPVLLVALDGPDRGRRVPFEATVLPAQTFSPENLLVVLPVQGVPLRPLTRYAVLVRASLGDAAGHPLGAPPALEALRAGVPPEGAHGASAIDAYGALFAWARTAGIAEREIAAATVFTTGDPRAELLGWRDAIASRPAAFSSARAEEDHDLYCVVRATIELPVFQRGPKPYAAPGTGQLVTDPAGALVEQERDRVDVLLTVPKRPMPPTGYPLLVYAAGAEGTARQVLDRTASAADPDAGLGPRGHGPARQLARRGVGALGFPTVHAWERNATGLDGGLLDFWNTSNLGAFRDNLRQAALDVTTLLVAASALELDASLCPGAGAASGKLRYDPGSLFFYGHSTGSTIGGMVVPLEPAVRAAMLSGAGGTWLQSLTMARSPFEFANVVRFLLSLDPDDIADRFDPPLTLFQTVMEPVDMTSWARHVATEPLGGRASRDLLLVEGVVDTYHFPRMASAYGMALGADVIEPAAEETWRAEYALVGRGGVQAPARGNVVGSDGAPRTVVTLQREAPPGIDGHYVPFEWPDVQYRYGCFFATAATGPRVVPAPSTDALAECPSL